MREIVVAVSVFAVACAAEAPELVVDGPEGWVSGPVVVDVTTAAPAVVQASLDGGAWQEVSGGSVEWPAAGLALGAHVLRVRARADVWDVWGLRSRRETERVVRFSTDDAAPQITAWLVPAAAGGPAQGEVFAVVVHSDEPVAAGSVEALGQVQPLRVHAGARRALLGVDVEVVPGEHPLVVQVEDGFGHTSVCTGEVAVAAHDFPFGGTIRLSGRQTRARRDTAALDKMRADRNRAYDAEHPRQYWSGALVVPVKGRRTSPFGRMRRYSDGRVSHHLGTDLAAVTGTPVHAPLAGVVAAAGWQHLFGNAVILHHGQGLTTSYGHLSRIDVQEGVLMEAGRVVGAVGSTGQSTGPHLHWGMQVGRVEVDPERWPAHGFGTAAKTTALDLECGPPHADTEPLY